MFHAYAHGISDALEKSQSATWTAKATLTSRDGSVELSTSSQASKSLDTVYVSHL